MSDVDITRNDFVCCFGMTRTGKSEIARSLWAAQPGPKVCVDIKGEIGARLPGVPTVSRPRDVLLYPTSRAVPPEPSDLDWYDELYTVGHMHGDFLYWLDEGNEPTSISRIPKGTRRFILQGKWKGCGHIMCTPRPADVHKTFETQCDHFFVFELQHPRDRKAIADITGLDPEHVDDRLDYIARFRVSAHEPSHHFLYYRPGMRELVAFEPIDDPTELTAKIGAKRFGSYSEGFS